MNSATTETTFTLKGHGCHFLQYFPAVTHLPFFDSFILSFFFLRRHHGSCNKCFSPLAASLSYTVLVVLD